ncbi:MAG: HutD family protein [Ilumatobacteraceae bacterium]
MPWRNGGGLTRELVVVGTEPFDWRLSAATIAADGPFSEFVGIDRILMLLRGDGVRLRFSDDASSETLDRPGAFVAFGGERPVEAALLGGSTTDLNLMWRRDRYRACVQPCLDAPSTDVVVVHVRDGSCTVESGGGDPGRVRLDAGDTAWWSDGAGRLAVSNGNVVRFDLSSGA